MSPAVEIMLDCHGAGDLPTLAEAKVSPEDPVILVLHCAYPRVEFADRGKSSLYLKG